MKFLICLGFIFFNLLIVLSQPKKDILKINSIRVYKDFQDRGYTLAGAYSHFDDMKKDSIEQINVNNENVEKLEMILNRAEEKNLCQIKFGTRNIFTEINFADSKTAHRVVISSVGIVYNMFKIVKEERGFITDLTKKINYKITNPEDLKWLKDFSARMNIN